MIGGAKQIQIAGTGNGHVEGNQTVVGWKTEPWDQRSPDRSGRRGQHGSDQRDYHGAVVRDMQEFHRLLLLLGVIMFL